jgi:hypothetical protein
MDKDALWLMVVRPVRLAYQSPASSIFLSDQTSHEQPASRTFLSDQTSHEQPASRTFLSEQTSTSHQPPAKRTGWWYFLFLFNKSHGSHL